jgi:hypothetical protein
MPTIDDILPMPKDLNTLPEPDPFYYVMGADGPYMMKRTLYGRALVKIKSIDHLPKHDGMLWHSIPKVPSGLIGQAWSFFRSTWTSKKSEAMVYLTHKDGVYRIFVPTQEASAAHVKTVMNPNHIAEGWIVAGTIHSHCNFGAFHSGTDTGDAADHDGLHITIGHVDTDKPSIEGMISVNGVNWDMEYEDYAGGDLVLVPHPNQWSRYIVGEVKDTTRSKWPPAGSLGYVDPRKGDPFADPDYDDWTEFGIARWANRHPAETIGKDVRVQVTPTLNGIKSYRADESPGEKLVTTALEAIRNGDLLGFEDEAEASNWLINTAEELDYVLMPIEEAGIHSYVSFWVPGTYARTQKPHGQDVLPTGYVPEVKSTAPTTNH